MTTISVGMGEIKLSKCKGDVLFAPGMGSCVGVSFYDKAKQIGCMAHVVLPESHKNRLDDAKKGKYADIAIPAMIEEIEKLGAKKSDIIVKISGGAQMFNFESGSNVMNIGMRNVIAVKAALKKEGLVVSKNHTGGNKGRTLKLSMETGIMSVKCIGEKEVEL